MSLLASPFNIKNKLFPYENLLSLDFLTINGFIAGVTNPIFMQKKNNWDLCCDIVFLIINRILEMLLIILIFWLIILIWNLYKI
jgi:hypothetical protein